MNTVLFETRDRLGLITLNRPEALNAIDYAMASAMLDQLQSWQDDSAIEAVIIRSMGGKAFCAGGDIRAIWKEPHRAHEFFAAEYELVRLIHNYPKPYIALIDGIVMGGGAGLSIHGSHRIATESAVFAMPETAIGFYPDVGATWFLPRLPGQIGTYLALTGARLGAADLLYTGLATHAVPSRRIEELIDGMAENGIEAALAAFEFHPGKPTLPALRPLIDCCFGFDTVEEILEALESRQDDRASAIAVTLGALSPTSLKITLRQMQLGKTLSFAEALTLEACLTARFMKGHDFFEGVRAMLIDRDKAPKWQPKSLVAVTDDQIAGYFS